MLRRESAYGQERLLLSVKSPSQSIATAIGQAIVYAGRYRESIAFLGIERSARWGKYPFRIEPHDQELKVYDALRAMGVRVVIREVGPRNRLEVLGEP